MRAFKRIATVEGKLVRWLGVALKLCTEIQLLACWKELQLTSV